jgi:hypothetical protein
LSRIKANLALTRAPANALKICREIQIVPSLPFQYMIDLKGQHSTFSKQAADAIDNLGAWLSMALHLNFMDVSLKEQRSAVEKSLKKLECLIWSVSEFRGKRRINAF